MTAPTDWKTIGHGLSVRANRVPFWVWYVVFFGGLAAAHDLGWMALSTAIRFGALIPSAIAHEVSHGVVALAFGDTTAKRAGRLTANPLPHISLGATVILPIVCALTFGVPFGAAKPVPVNVSKLRNPRNASVYVALAGPATNLLILGLLFGASVVAGVHGLVPSIPSFDAQPTWMLLLFEAGFLNLLLALFNLLPIPPLDGSAVIERILPDRAMPRYFQIRQVAFPLVIVVVLLGHNILAWPELHLSRWWFSVFYGSGA